MRTLLAIAASLAICAGAQAHQPGSCDLSGISKQYDALQSLTEQPVPSGLGADMRQRLEFVLTQYESLAAVTTALNRAYLTYVQCAEGR